MKSLTSRAGPRDVKRRGKWGRDVEALLDVAFDACLGLVVEVVKVVELLNLLAHENRIESQSQGEAEEQFLQVQSQVVRERGFEGDVEAVEGAVGTGAKVGVGLHCERVCWGEESSCTPFNRHPKGRCASERQSILAVHPEAPSHCRWRVALASRRAHAARLIYVHALQTATYG